MTGTSAHHRNKLVASQLAKKHHALTNVVSVTVLLKAAHMYPIDWKQCLYIHLLQESAAKLTSVRKHTIFIRQVKHFTLSHY